MAIYKTKPTERAVDVGTEQTGVIGLIIRDGISLLEEDEWVKPHTIATQKQLVGTMTLALKVSVEQGVEYEVAETAITDLSNPAYRQLLAPYPHELFGIIKPPERGVSSIYAVVMMMLRRVDPLANDDDYDQLDPRLRALVYDAGLAEIGASFPGDENADTEADPKKD